MDKNKGNPFIFICVDKQTDRQTDGLKLAHGCIENKPMGTQPKGCRLAAKIQMSSIKMI